MLTPITLNLFEPLSTKGFLFQNQDMRSMVL